MNSAVTGAPTLVLSSTFPQHAGDHRGLFLLRYWEAKAAAGERVCALVPRTAWSRDDLPSAVEIRRFAYAPRRLSSLTGHFGTLENIRERPWRALLLPAYAVGLARSLSRAIAEQRPQRVVAHFLLPGGWLAAELAKRSGIPCEIYGHGTDIDVAIKLPGPLRRRLAAALRGCTKVTFPSAEKRAYFASKMGFGGIPKHFTVETMVTTVATVGARPAGAGPRAGVLYVGRLIRQKGVDDLLRAAATLGPQVPVEIAGDGPERPRLEQLARALSVRARFHGFVDPCTRDRLYQRAAVVCVPSRRLANGLSEGAPLVICEARAHGLPVVASAVGGIPELCVDDPGATLVPPADPAALARALQHALASAPASSQAPRRRAR